MHVSEIILFKLYSAYLATWDLYNDGILASCDSRQNHITIMYTKYNLETVNNLCKIWY